MIEPLIALAGRLEYAKQEIGAAHGMDWKNDFLDIVANNLRTRTDRIEKWCAVVNSKGFLPRKHNLTSDSLESQNAFRAMDNMLYEQGHAPVFNDADLENWLWTGNFFDEMDVSSVGFIDGFAGCDPVAQVGVPISGMPVDPCVVYQ